MKMERMYLMAEDYFKTLDGLNTKAVLIALEAIGKQIPKKPVLKITAYGNCKARLACPNCKAELENGKTDRFCQLCGQAIKQGGEQ